MYGQLYPFFGQIFSKLQCGFKVFNAEQYIRLKDDGNILTL